MKPPHQGPIPPRAPGAARPALDLTKLDLGQLRRERARVIGRAEAHNPPITRVVPVPRAIPLGPGLRVVSEFRLRDLAEIQAWLEEQIPHPLDGMPPAWADPEPGTRKARLAAAWEAAGSWPVRYGTDRADRLLATEGGRAFFLALAVRREDPGFGAREALALLPEVTPAQWAGLVRVVYGLTPRQEIAAELAPDRPDAGRTVNWWLSAYRACQAQGGPCPPDLGGWSLGQWRLFCTEGKAAEMTAEFGETTKRVKRALEADDGR